MLDRYRDTATEEKPAKEAANVAAVKTIKDAAKEKTGEGAELEGMEAGPDKDRDGGDSPDKDRDGGDGPGDMDQSREDSPMRLDEDMADWEVEAICQALWRKVER